MKNCARCLHPIDDHDFESSNCVASPCTVPGCECLDVRSEFEHEGLCTVEEFMEGVAPSGKQQVAIEVALNACETTTTMLLALVRFYEQDTPDVKGARMLRKFARIFAEYERRSL